MATSGNNFGAFVRWAIRTLWWGLAGVPVGILGGTVVAMVNGTERFGDFAAFVVGGAFTGAGIAAALPAVVAVWFLFLHMIGQVSAAARGKD